MEKPSELEKTVKALEKRVLKLEEILLKQKPIVEEPQPKANDFKGLIGGVNFLISRGFLATPKAVKEIHEELKKEGYHYSEKSVGKILTVDLMQKRKMLTRVEEEGVWKYVLRK